MRLWNASIVKGSTEQHGDYMHLYTRCASLKALLGTMASWVCRGGKLTKELDVRGRAGAGVISGVARVRRRLLNIVRPSSRPSISLDID